MLHKMINATRWTPHYSQMLTLFNIVILVLLVISLIFLSKNILSAMGRQKHPYVYPASDASQANVKKQVQEYEVILQNNPFGFPAGPLKALSSSPGAAAFSDLKLLGTISGTSIHGYAVLADKDGKQVMFKTGESVFESGKLKKVEKYRVFIEKNGRLHEISMTDAILSDDLQKKSGSPLSVRQVGKGEYLLDQKSVLLALDKPHQIMTDAKLVPNMVGGRQEGFLLREIKRNGIYDNLGMQNGDILLRINNYGISNPENALQAFMALRGMDRVQLDVVRGGNKMTMTYQIK
jgi:general secretion pathway protein C